MFRWKFSRLMSVVVGAMVIFGLILSACGSSDESSSQPMGMTVEEAPADSQQSFYDSTVANSNEQPQGQQTQTEPMEPSQERIVIKNARMSVISEDVPERIAEIAAVVSDMNGWVVSSNTTIFTNYANEEVERGTITVRVPSDELDGVMARIESSVQEVRSSTVTGEDVTQQFVDQESRLKNLQAAEEQLQAIMDDANSTQDVLAVYNELVRIRGEIEVIQGQLNYWSQAAAFSSLVVDLEPPTPEPVDAEEARWSPGETVEDAWAALVDGLKVAVDALIWIVIFVLPFALILSVVVWIGYRVARRFYPGWFAPSQQAS